jgi:hypothetical protein
VVRPCLSAAWFRPIGRFQAETTLIRYSICAGSRGQQRAYCIADCAGAATAIFLAGYLRHRWRVGTILRNESENGFTWDRDAAVTPVPSNCFRPLFTLALLAAGPFVGLGGHARACPIAPGRPQRLPQIDLFQDGLPPTECWDNAPSAAPVASTDEAQLRPDHEPILLPVSHDPLWLGVVGASTGAGCQAPPHQPGSDGPVQPFYTTPRPSPAAPGAIGVLFLATARHGTPLFPSGLFRPPRRA